MQLWNPEDEFSAIYVPCRKAIFLLLFGPVTFFGNVLSHLLSEISYEETKVYKYLQLPCTMNTEWFLKKKKHVRVRTSTMRNKKVHA